MPTTVTLTAKIGPAVQATSMALTDVTGINFDLAAKTVAITYGDPPKTLYADESNPTSVTTTVSGGIISAMAIVLG